MHANPSATRRQPNVVSRFLRYALEWIGGATSNPVASLPACARATRYLHEAERPLVVRACARHVWVDSRLPLSRTWGLHHSLRLRGLGFATIPVMPFIQLSVSWSRGSCICTGSPPSIILVQIRCSPCSVSSVRFIASRATVLQLRARPSSALASTLPPPTPQRGNSELPTWSSSYRCDGPYVASYRVVAPNLPVGSRG